MGEAAGSRIYGGSMQQSGLDAEYIDRSLFDALVDAAAELPDHDALEDQTRQPVTRSRVLLGATVLGRRLVRGTRRREIVGLMLPNVVGCVIAFFGLAAYDRTPALLNFTAGPRNLDAMLTVGGIRKVVTSRQFVATAKLEPVIEQFRSRVEIIYLEDLRDELGLADKLIGALYAKAPRFFHRLWRRAPGDVAAVLFTSGTEGTPKGVALSSSNFLSNVAQILKLYTFVPDDKMFNALPVFHSYGLTAGLFLPLYGRFKAFLYPSPLHYKAIPELVRDSHSTVLLSTDTFAAGWARAADEGAFDDVHMTFLGAERVKDQTRALWQDRFGVELNEGYGATECAPVLAVNYPGSSKHGTVGRLLPGIEARIEPVPGLDVGGRLYVRGPNIMIGYYLGDRPGQLQRVVNDGWYDTGDIVTIDDEDFVTVRGRAKRFAKIGGEMVSLAAVEAYAGAIWPDSSHAVVSIPDPRKGEALVLVTDSGTASVEAFIAYGHQHGLPELSIPRKIVKTYSLPVLGTGKMDLPAIEVMARS
jgi:acyl-[acyl-carrier-protein]-phospholipid O-acyltransferase/long-chain-fatty-acid--[acyl-carrier-protein] ligase